MLNNDISVRGRMLVNLAVSRRMYVSVRPEAILYRTVWKGRLDDSDSRVYSKSMYM